MVKANTNRLVDPVELKKPAILFADFPCDVTIPPIGGQSIFLIFLAIEDDVVWAVEADDIITVSEVVSVAAGLGVLEEQESHFVACRS